MLFKHFGFRVRVDLYILLLKMLISKLLLPLYNGKESERMEYCDNPQASVVCIYKIPRDNEVYCARNKKPLICIRENEGNGSIKKQ